MICSQISYQIIFLGLKDGKEAASVGYIFFESEGEMNCVIDSNEVACQK